VSEIIEVQLSDLKPFPLNPATHSDDQIAALVGSIQEFGWRGVIEIDEDNVILSGHGRVEAAKLAGLESVKAERFDDMTDAQKHAWVIAANKLAAMAGLNVEILEMNVGKLVDDGYDISLTGYKEWELARLFDDPADHDSDSDSSGEQGTNRPVISVTVVFDDEEQKEKWYAFMRILKAEFPEALTTAQRLTSHIKSLAE
jgi:hypothetical protein